jgi:hypothetical protein
MKNSQWPLLIINKEPREANDKGIIPHNIIIIIYYVKAKKC